MLGRGNRQGRTHNPTAIARPPKTYRAYTTQATVQVTNQRNTIVQAQGTEVSAGRPKNKPPRYNTPTGNADRLVSPHDPVPWRAHAVRVAFTSTAASSPGLGAATIAITCSFRNSSKNNRSSNLS